MARSDAASPALGTRSGLGFVLWFAALAVLFELAFFGLIAHSRLYQEYLELNVRGAAALLRLLGQEARSEGVLLSTDSGAISVQLGCDAVEATGLFLIAVLLYPTTGRQKLLGVIGGVVLLSGLNLARLASLVLLQPRSDRIFRIVHLALWPAALILAAVVTWVVWALRAPRSRT